MGPGAPTILGVLAFPSSLAVGAAPWFPAAPSDRIGSRWFDLVDLFPPDWLVARVGAVVASGGPDGIAVVDLGIAEARRAAPAQAPPLLRPCRAGLRATPVTGVAAAMGVAPAVKTGRSFRR